MGTPWPLGVAAIALTAINVCANPASSAPLTHRDLRNLWYKATTEPQKEKRREKTNLLLKQPPSKLNKKPEATTIRTKKNAILAPPPSEFNPYTRDALKVSRVYRKRTRQKVRTEAREEKAADLRWSANDAIYSSPKTATSPLNSSRGTHGTVTSGYQRTPPKPIRPVVEEIGIFSPPPGPPWKGLETQSEAADEAVFSLF
jgi:hypothetical protein